ncbi:MAG: MFS transporter [Elusimicrobia bacterium]|nr:MFS transporter [Elusimicrobiota bacterium]
MSDVKTEPVPVLDQVRKMSRNFWVANLIEAGERLAFFGVRAVLPLYLVGTTGAALGLSYSQKGIIYMVWALLQCLVPMVSGGYADAYGYKKSMCAAFGINICGYLVMANASGFWSMMAAGMLVGVGTAIFKPPVQGAVAKALDGGNSGLGFGIFYWVVNIGGFIAPMAAAWARGNEARPTWSLVFYGAALVTAWNFIPALFLFEEPPIDPAARSKRAGQVFADTMRTLWRDKAMLRFLLVVSGFWFMFMQLWDLLPNFIDEWVNTADVGAFLSATLGGKAQSFLTAAGAAKPEILINIDSFVIILLVLPLSWLFGRFAMMTALVLGMAVSLLGFVGAGATTSGALCAFMIFVFAVGEIICSPKFSEYVGMTAPPDKKAVYMGFSNIPFAIGWAAGNGLSGPLYDHFASRAVFARRMLVERFSVPPEAASAIAPDRLLGELAARMGSGATANDAVRLLWDAYHPWVVWVLLGIVGLASVAGMVLNYSRSARAVPEAVPEPAEAV